MPITDSFISDDSFTNQLLNWIYIMKKSILAAVVALVLAGCGPDEQPKAVPSTPVATVPAAAPVVNATPAQPQVVVVQQPAQQSNGMENALLGAAAGYALGSMGRPAAPSRDSYYERPRTQVINRTIIVEKHIPAPVAKPAVVPTPPVPATVKPAYQPSPSVISPSKMVPAAPTKANPKFSLAKPTAPTNNSFGGFNRR